MKVTIHPAFAEVIQQRSVEMQTLIAQFNVLRSEDKRNTDAMLKALGHDPSKLGEYKLNRDGESWVLECTEQKATEPGVLPVPADGAQPAHVNGVAN